MRLILHVMIAFYIFISRLLSLLNDKPMCSLYPQLWKNSMILRIGPTLSTTCLKSSWNLQRSGSACIFSLNVYETQFKFICAIHSYAVQHFSSLSCNLCQYPIIIWLVYPVISSSIISRSSIAMHIPGLDLGKFVTRMQHWTNALRAYNSNIFIMYRQLTPDTMHMIDLGVLKLILTLIILKMEPAKYKIFCNRCNTTWVCEQSMRVCDSF